MACWPATRLCWWREHLEFRVGVPKSNGLAWLGMVCLQSEVLQCNRLKRSYVVLARRSTMPPPTCLHEAAPLHSLFLLFANLQHTSFQRKFFQFWLFPCCVETPCVHHQQASRNSESYNTVTRGNLWVRFLQRKHLSCNCHSIKGGSNWSCCVVKPRTGDSANERCQHITGDLPRIDHPSKAN